MEELEEKDAVVWIKAVEQYLLELRSRVEILEESRSSLLQDNSTLKERVRELTLRVEELESKFEEEEGEFDSRETTKNGDVEEIQSIQPNAVPEPQPINESYERRSSTAFLQAYGPSGVFQNHIYHLPTHPQVDFKGPIFQSEGERLETSGPSSESGYHTEKDEPTGEEEEEEATKSSSDSNSFEDSEDEKFEEEEEQSKDANEFTANKSCNEIELEIDIENDGERGYSNESFPLVNSTLFTQSNATQNEGAAGPVIKFPADAAPLGKAFQCPSCPKTFLLKRFLSNHLRIHANTPFKVIQPPPKILILSKPKNADVKKESLKITPEPIIKKKRSRSYICSYCSKEFSNSYSLKTHERSHTNERPYACTFCSKRFLQKGHLDQHTRIHTGETPFKCKNGCGKGFPQQTQMIQHLRRCKAPLNR